MQGFRAARRCPRVGLLISVGVSSRDAPRNDFYMFIQLCKTIPSRITRGYASYAPGPLRKAHRVRRCSSTANTAYIATPIAAITIRPANTSGTSKRELAATIR